MGVSKGEQRRCCTDEKKGNGSWIQDAQSVNYSLTGGYIFSNSTCHKSVAFILIFCNLSVAVQFLRH